MCVCGWELFQSYGRLCAVGRECAGRLLWVPAHTKGGWQSTIMMDSNDDDKRAPPAAEQQQGALAHLREYHPFQLYAFRSTRGLRVPLLRGARYALISLV